MAERPHVRFGARLKLVASAGDPVEGADQREGDDRKGVQSVDIAFSILRVLEVADRSLTLGEIAQRAGQQPSKAHHYLVSLIRNGVAAQRPDGRYELGSYALTLGLSALSRLDIVERSVEAVAAFRDETGEAAFLAVWGNRGPTIVRYVEGARAVTVEAKAGLVLPVLTSATGRVFLAWGSEPAWRPIASAERAGLPRAQTARSAERIGALTRSRGISLIEGDLLPRIAALSVPVLTHDGSLACAITTLGLMGELDVRRDGATALKLHAVGRELSARFGCVAYPALRQPRRTGQRANLRDGHAGRSR